MAKTLAIVLVGLEPYLVSSNGVSGIFQRRIKAFRRFTEGIAGGFRELSKKFQGVFRGVARYFKFQDVSGSFRKFRELSKKFQRRFKVFQGFPSCFWRFQEDFKEVS